MSGVSKPAKILKLNDIIPDEGDAVTIINRGGFFEVVSVMHGIPSTLELTEEDVEAMKAGEITWQ